MDIQCLNRLFVNSAQLDSEAIVDFVSALCNVSREELKSVHAPRVFSLTKIVEIAHFNMGRIRYGMLRHSAATSAKSWRVGPRMGSSHPALS